MLMVQVTSRMYARIGPRKNMITAGAGLLLTTCLFFFVGLNTDLWLVRGCFIAFNMVAMQTAAFSAVPRSKTGRAASRFSTLRQVGAALGVAMVGTVLTSQVHDLNVSADAAVAAVGLQAFHTSLLPLVCMNLIGLTFASRIRDADAAVKPRVVAAPAPRHETAAAAGD
jgi:MFS family permease